MGSYHNCTATQKLCSFLKQKKFKPAISVNINRKKCKPLIHSAFYNLKFYLKPMSKFRNFNTGREIVVH